jgi:hypothetical protein
LNYVTVASLVFAVVYACALTFEYVEGDDAASIAFHALGRNPQVQPPYSPYHGMLDLWLRILPPQEPLLRFTAISISSVAAMISIILALTLIFGWLGEDSRTRKPLVVLAVLLSAPEFFFLGLVYEPTMIAMCLVLSSHLLLRRIGIPSNLSKVSGKISILFSLVLFGVGVACRWDVGLYGVVIVSDLVLGRNHDSNSLRLKRRQLAFGLAWAVLAVIAVVVTIRLTGYGIRDFYEVLRLAQKEVSNQPSWLWKVGAFQSLFTPAFLVFLLTGFISLTRKHKRLALIVVLGTLPVIPFLFSREPKMLMPAIPGLLLCVVTGFEVLWFSRFSMSRLLMVRAAIGFMLIGPWLVGISIDSSETSWGPGFEIRAEGKGPNVDADPKRANEDAGKQNASFRKIMITAQGGFAFPTAEGPRPFGGYAATLLGGKWRALINELSKERQNTISFALSSGIPIIQDDRNSFVIVNLLRMGFITQSPGATTQSSQFTERTFFNNRGEHITVFMLKERGFLFRSGHLRELATAAMAERVCLYSGYSSTIKRLGETAPKAVESLGPFSLTLNIYELQRALDKRHD